MWIDSHCHPYFEHFDQDMEEMLKRAQEAGVEKMIVIGCDKKTNRKTLEICEKYDFMYATLGAHPCESADLDEEELNFIKKHSKKIVAIGEIGLDYHNNHFPKEVQADILRKQIRLANELDLPSVVHSRNAPEDTLQILIEEKPKKVVFHCYSYDYEFGKKVWDKGYYTSFSGVLTYPNAKGIQEAAKKGPLELFMIETDSPFLPPQKYRGQRNEPAFLNEVGEKLAELRGITKNELAQITSKNVSDFFKLIT